MLPAGPSATVVATVVTILCPLEFDVDEPVSAGSDDSGAEEDISMVLGEAPVELFSQGTVAGSAPEGFAVAARDTIGASEVDHAVDELPPVLESEVNKEERVCAIGVDVTATEFAEIVSTGSLVFVSVVVVVVVIVVPIAVSAALGVGVIVDVKADDVKLVGDSLEVRLVGVDIVVTVECATVSAELGVAVTPVVKCITGVVAPRFVAVVVDCINDCEVERIEAETDGVNVEKMTKK